VSYFVDSLVRVKDVGRPPQRLGKFRTREEAYAASRHSIDRFLSLEFEPGMPAKILYERFRNYAALPFVCGDDADISDFLNFNPIKYALERCEEICGEPWLQA
jgi:hypothetical protein